jgi:guanyl-specific ribonuclease Sa
LNGFVTFLLDSLVFGYRSVPFSQVKERAFGVANGVKGWGGFEYWKDGLKFGAENNLLEDQCGSDCVNRI